MAVISNILNWSMAFAPDGAFPLDARSLFYSKATADAAAATAEAAGSTSTTYYIGQILTVYENGVVSHYSIQEDKTLKEVGAAVMGDDQAIVVGDDGKISMKGFGTEYYKYIAKDTIIEEGEYAYPDNMPADADTGAYVKVDDVWYVLTADEDGTTSWVAADAEPRTEDGYELTQGWTTGLTPQVIVNDNSVYEMAWFEPSKITVEGLSSSMSSLQATVENMSTNVTANTEAINKLNGDAQTEGSVDYKIANILDSYLTGDGDTSKVDTLKDLINWAETHNTEVANYGTDIQSNKDAIAELQQNALTDASQFATAEQGKLADTALQPEDIVASTNGHLTVDGTDVKVYELQPAKYGVLGGVSPDGTSITTDDNGVASVAAVDYTKVTGLTEQLASYQTGAINTAKEYANETFIPKDNIVASTDVVDDVTAASEEKVVSEKAWMEAMTWKDSM